MIDKRVIIIFTLAAIFLASCQTNISGKAYAECVPGSCPDGLWCNGGICEEPIRAGGDSEPFPNDRACEFDGDCQSGICIEESEQCEEELRQLFEGCQVPSDCETGICRLRRSEGDWVGICTDELSGEGEQCNFAMDCEANLICQNQVCVTEEVIEVEQETYTFCRENEDCETGICDVNVCVPAVERKSALGCPDYKELIAGHNSNEERRINLVFAGIDTERGFNLREKAVKLINFGSGEVMDDDFNGFTALFNLEPFKSNKDNFNLWYIDRRFESSNSPRNDKEQDHYCIEKCYTELEDNRCMDSYLIGLCQQECQESTLLDGQKITIIPIVEGENGLSQYLQSPVISHELGHSFANLADEYYPARNPRGPSTPRFPNCAGSEDQAREYWGDLVGEGEHEMMVTELRSRGCNYNIENFNPSANSIMNTGYISSEYNLVSIRHICYRIFEETGDMRGPCLELLQSSPEEAQSYLQFAGAITGNTVVEPYNKPKRPSLVVKDSEKSAESEHMIRFEIVDSKVSSYSFVEVQGYNPFFEKRGDSLVTINNGKEGWTRAYLYSTLIVEDFTRSGIELIDVQQNLKPVVEIDVPVKSLSMKDKFVIEISNEKLQYKFVCSNGICK